MNLFLLTITLFFNLGVMPPLRKQMTLYPKKIVGPIVILFIYHDAYILL